MRQPTVLIVDDEPTNIEILNQILEPEYDIICSTDGPSALDLVDRQNPDLILLNVMMPEMSGYEVLETLNSREARREIPVIFVTAWGDERAETKGLGLGAADYVVKPFRPATIKARVRNTLVRYQTERRLSEELERDVRATQSRIAVSALLETSLEPLPLKKQLGHALDIILSIPWLAVEYKGSIHLLNESTGKLELTAQRFLAAPLLTQCAELDIGECLCGLAAQRREIVFRSCLDHDHTVNFPGISEHGHYCIPILLQARLLGVLNLYVPHHHKRLPEEDALLTTIANTLAGLIENRYVEQALEDERRFITTIMESTAAFVVVLAPDGRVVQTNRAFMQLTSMPESAILGKYLWDEALTVQEDAEALRTALLEAALGVRANACESRWRVGEDQPERIISWSNTALKDASGEVANVIATGIDVTERRQAEKRLERLAHNDALTGLPNRRLFTDLLDHAIQRADRNKGRISVMFMDLDRFKAVNDTLGHDIGDMLLIEASQRIQAVLRKNDVVARLGGDEFTVILSDKGPDREEASLVAQKILDTLQQPFHLKEHECKIGASIGISHYPDHGEDVETLIKKADIAMYAVKRSGRNRQLTFDASLETPSES
ncbi:MAG: diguanylate cyclase [Magnetococcales bacterium]|nr:diguanylate cyclase [Magnetococcales bacterium]